MNAPVHHVLWVTQNHFPGRGGMAQSCERIVRALRALGVRVDVVHLTGRAGAVRAEAQVGGRLIVAPLEDDPSHGLNVLWSWLENDAQAASITHVVAFGGQLPLVAAPVFAAWLARPLVTLLRGNDFDAAVFQPKRADVLHHALARSAAVCTVTRAHQRRVRALHPAVDVDWIPNGIDAAGFAATAGDRARAAAWRAAQIAPGRRVLGLFGHLKRKKGAVLLLGSLLDSGAADRTHALLVGEVDEELAAWLDAHPGLAHTRVPFTDRCDLPRWYAACDLVALPSYYDGLPNVMLEAAALGLPLVAARAGGMADWLAEGVHGFVFAPGDADGCRRALLAAADSPAETLAAMGRRARALVDGGLDDASEARAYAGVLNRTAARPALSART